MKTNNFLRASGSSFHSHTLSGFSCEISPGSDGSGMHGWVDGDRAAVRA
jgi:hypothetical protein